VVSLELAGNGGLGILHEARGGGVLEELLVVFVRFPDFRED
jgi:hypothetical protein